MRLSLARKGNVRYNIMITGRPDRADIQRAFADAAALELAIVPDKEDMELAVKEKIKFAKERHKISARLELDILATVLENADGM
jgi:hypothetical protein